MEIAVELGPMLEPAGMEGSGVYFYATAIPRLPTPAGGDVTTLHLAIAAEDHSGRTAIWPGFLVNPVKVSSGPCRTFLIPFWQSGWGLETIFSYSNLPSSAAAATVQTDLYYYDNQAAEFDFFSAPPMWLDNGSANYLTTSDTNWYTIGDEFGAALVTVQYEDAPDDTDRFSAWAVAYADPSTGFPGLAISVPDSPAGPNTKHANLGSGRFPLSYWVNDGTETSYFLVYNSSTSLTDAIIRFEWQDGEGDGNLPATQAIVPPGEFRQIDPPSGVGVTYGMGDITVAFEGVPNQYNEVSIYSVVYGIMDIGGGQSMQVGYAVDLKRPSPPLPGTGAQEEFDIAIPFWQDGWDQHTVWSIYNSADSTSDSVTVSLKLYDASSTLVEESTSTVLEPGEGVVLDTQYDAWYELTANKLGYAYLHMVYADSPGREDVVSFWSAVYSVAADGTHAGYQVTSRDCAIRPHNLDPAVANYETRGFGEQTVAVPFWIEYDGTLPMHTFYSIWNSADSDHNVDITLHLRDYDNTESVSKVIASITPGTFQMIDTSNSYFDDLEGLSGVGEITIDFSGTPTADDRVFLWSCYYSAYQSVPLGFDIALQ